MPIVQLFVGWLLSPDSMKQIKIMPLVKFDVSFFHCVHLVYVTRTLCFVMLCCICIIIPREIKRMNSGNMHILPTNREFIVQKKYSKRTIPGETEKKIRCAELFSTFLISLSISTFFSFSSMLEVPSPPHVHEIHLFMKQRQ